MFRVGVISDTHGLLRPQALEALAGAQHLIHAGDVGAPEVLAQLRELAPITAVRGNNDVGAWAAALPPAVTFELEGLRLHLLHDVAELALAPAELGIRAVIAGHSHRPAIRESARGAVSEPRQRRATPVQPAGVGGDGSRSKTARCRRAWSNSSSDRYCLKRGTQRTQRMRREDAEEGIGGSLREKVG